MGRFDESPDGARYDAVAPLLLNDKAITVPVPIAEVTTEDRYRSFPIADIDYFVVQLSGKRFDSIMQFVAGIPYEFNKPSPFWFFIGKDLSKTFFDNEGQLEWFNAVRIRSWGFIAFTNTQRNRSHDARTLQVVEIDFLKPQPKENLKLYWKPARGIIRQKVQDCKSFQGNA
ncbi:hypothetical protein N7540_003477 [Penicillium herquei]|nr:hypothetical protein N7540_003477 [Penicillium herquei]